MDPIHQEVAGTLMSKEKKRGGGRGGGGFSKSIQEFSEKEIPVHSDLYLVGRGPL